MVEIGITYFQKTAFCLEPIPMEIVVKLTLGKSDIINLDLFSESDVPKNLCALLLQFLRAHPFVTLNVRRVLGGGGTRVLKPFYTLVRIKRYNLCSLSMPFV